MTPLRKTLPLVVKNRYSLKLRGRSSLLKADQINEYSILVDKFWALESSQQSIDLTDLQLKSHLINVSLFLNMHQHSYEVAYGSITTKSLGSFLPIYNSSTELMNSSYLITQSWSFLELGRIIELPQFV
jgi:hypothetical protein